MPLQLLSFDLDGTLVDTAGETAQAANMTLADAGLPPASLEQVTRLIGGGAQALMQRLLALTQPPIATTAQQQAALLRRFDRAYAQVAGTLARPYPGCHETLEQLRSVGVQLACVTNKEHMFARQVLQATQLDGFFALLIGGDTLAQKKPHHSVLDHVRRAFATAPEQTAHVGDSRIDVLAARNAGVAAWAVSYGYNAGLPISDAGPDRIFDSLPALGHHVCTAIGAPPA